MRQNHSFHSSCMGDPLSSGGDTSTPRSTVECKGHLERREWRWERKGILRDGANMVTWEVFLGGAQVVVGVKRVKMFKGKQGKGKEVQRIIGNPLVCTRHHA